MAVRQSMYSDAGDGALPVSLFVACLPVLYCAAIMVHEGSDSQICANSWQPFAIGASAYALGAPAAAAPDDKAIYDRIVSLRGDWTGHMEEPLRSAGHGALRVASGGKAIIEYQTDREPADGHGYFSRAETARRAVFAAGNSRLQARRGSTAELALLEFDGGTGFDADHEARAQR